MKKTLLSIVLMISATASWALEVECTPGNLASLIDDTSITSLTITGEIDARDFKFIADELDALTSINLAGATIVGYSNNTKPLFNNEVNYPENCIPPMAFFGKKLTQVSLPASTRAIGMAAFAGCYQLSNFSFPQALDSIAAYAFSAARIGNLILPTTVRFMGEGAFSNINSLTQATINPAEPMAIPKSAFEGCQAFTTVTLGPNVIAIGDRAFKGDAKLSNINFAEANNIQSIGNEALLGTKVSNFNFQQATTLSNIGEWAFAQSKQASATIPANITNVGKGAFYYATDLTSFVPNAASDTIADMLLAGTAVTNDITSKTHVKHIGAYAFYNTPVTTLTLPSTTTYIGDRAMAGMINLTELASEATQVPELGEEVWIGVKQATIPLKVPQESYDAYSTADQWQRFLVWAEEPQGIPGDVNQDGFVTAADITCLYGIILGNTTDYMDTADVNNDGEVTAADITFIYNILLGNANAPGRNKKVFDNNDHLSADAFVIEAGKTHTMDVNMRNNAQFAAMQFDITMPQGLTIAHVATTTRASHMTMGYNEIEPGKWRILIHSATTTSSNEGALLNVTVKALEGFTGNDIITISNIIAVEPNELTHQMNDVDVEVGTVTGVKDINIDDAHNGPVNVYNMNGQLIRQNVERNEATTGLPSGIYIVGGKKVVVK